MDAVEKYLKRGNVNVRMLQYVSSLSLVSEVSP